MIIESYAPGTPSWVDLMTTDQDAAISFYSDLFGWEIFKSGEAMNNYAMCMKNNQPVAGIGTMPEGSAFPACWTTYISVSSADDTVAKVTEAGGRVESPAMTVEGDGRKVGRMAIVADPTNAVFGIWEPMDHKGSGLANEPGSFTWNELLSRDPQASRDFLAAVFDYDWQAMSAVEDMDYFTANIEGNPVLGAMIVPP